MPDRLIAVSVKSNGAGNSSTIIGCLPVVELDTVTTNDKDSENLLEFFNEIIPQFESESKVELKLSDKVKDKVQNLSLYTLSLLKEETANSKTSNPQKLVTSFEHLIDLIKDEKDLYTQLHKICELAGTNTIEKIFGCLFNANSKTIDLIKNAVADAPQGGTVTLERGEYISINRVNAEDFAMKNITVANNNKDATVNTGIFIATWPYLLAAALGLGGFIVFRRLSRAS